MNVLDLFCGCGGLSQGFKLANFNIVGGVDSDEDSISTFSKNFPGSNAICKDILIFDKKKIEENYSNIDVIIGGPPCQGFSNANRWHKKKDDSRNKLFFEYLKFVEVLRPKVVLIENVKGILSRNNGFAKVKIEQLIKDLGYNVSSKVLFASDFGIPQYRQRAFFVCINTKYKNIFFDFDNLEKKAKVTVKEAIGDLYNLKMNKNHQYKTPSRKKLNDYLTYLRSSDIITSHEIKYPAESTQEKISHVAQGGNWSSIPEHLFKTSRSNRHSSAFKRLDEKDCSVTIDTGNAHSNYFHPIYNRIPTVREAARIQSFQDDFQFCGSRTSQYKQVGNAVPPLLSFQLAKKLQRIL